MAKNRDTPNDRNGPDIDTARDDMMRDLTRLLGRQDFANIDEVNAFLQREVMGKPLPRVKAVTNRERAEDLVMSARNERSLVKVRTKAANALALDADCIAAHQLLAEVAEGPVAALAHCRDGIAAGDRALAQELRDGDATLWYNPIGRQYLMVRFTYADLLWQSGDRPAALDEARAILRLNPGDNQGTRYVLLGWLMRAGSVAAIDALLAEFDDASASWMFTIALHQYRMRGPVAEANKALHAAMTQNAHVIPMLLGEVAMPEELPDSYILGHETEAALYVNASISTWIDAVGAMEWLVRAPRVKPRAKTAGRKRR